MKAALYAIGNRRGINVRMTLDVDVDRSWWRQVNLIEKNKAENLTFVPISSAMPLQWAVRLAGSGLEAAALDWGREQWERWMKKRLGSALARENPAEIADLLGVCAKRAEGMSVEDRRGPQQGILQESEVWAAKAERLARLLEGRSLLRGELESLLHDLAPDLAADWRNAAQFAYLQGRIVLRAAIERADSRVAGASAGEIRRGWSRLAQLSVRSGAGSSGAQTCARCGSTASGARCAACGSADCARCEACRTLGRSRSCELLVQGAAVPRVMRGVGSEVTGSAARLPEVRARLARWKLSPAQSAAAESALRFLEREARPEETGKGRLIGRGVRGARGEDGYGRVGAARAREAAGESRDGIPADRYAREGEAGTLERASCGGTNPSAKTKRSARSIELHPRSAGSREEGLHQGAKRGGMHMEPHPISRAGGGDVSAWTAADPASRFLLWAVTGAGKTEMLFPLIESVRSRGGRVAVATPRRDVVLELAPRLRRAFPGEEIAALYGGSEERWRSGDLVLATTHQLLRFARAFDLVVIDELDAFPFHGDPMLAYAAEAARALGGRTVYLSATPPPELQRLVRAGRVACAKVPVRYHRHPLPVPKLLRTPPVADFVRAGKLPPSLLRRWRTSLARGAQIFVFVPKIALAEPLAALLRRAFKNVPVGATSSRDEDRAAKVLSFRSAELRMLVTTTILERGVTVPRSDVYVLDADSGLFDEASLVQMAGRAGRSADDPAGAVVFAAAQKTRAQSGARRQIRRMNRLARPYLLPEAARSSMIFRLPKLRQASDGTKRRSAAPASTASAPPKPACSEAGASLFSASADPTPPGPPAAACSFRRYRQRLRFSAVFSVFGAKPRRRPAMSGLGAPAALLRRLLMPVSDPCLSCGRPAAAAATGELPLLCERCSALVPWIERPRCPICGRAHGCPDCLRPEARRRTFVLNRSAALYDATMRRWIAEYKYGGREAFATPFSVMLERTYRRMRRELSVQEKDRGPKLFYRKTNAWQADLVTWVPVSEQRLEERGFNQAELAARQMALRLRLPAAELLTRSVHTGKQSFKKRSERLHNLDGAFSLLPNLDPRGFKKWDLVGNPKRPGGPFPIRVLLVDDIYTTGTTAAVCASALKPLENVFERPVLVYILTLARS